MVLENGLVALTKQFEYEHIQELVTVTVTETPDLLRDKGSIRLANGCIELFKLGDFIFKLVNTYE